jgi:hypothetical protein
MFFIPMAIWIGHPQITVAMYIWKGIIPVLLGNIVGGGLFCGGYYYMMYAWQNPSIMVDGKPIPPPPADMEGMNGQQLQTKRDVASGTDSASEKASKHS